MNNEKHYQEMDPVVASKHFEEHVSIINDFLENNGYEVDKLGISINSAILHSIITRIHQREAYYSYFHDLHISEYKEVGLVAFWYMKLCPLQITREVNGGKLESLNEKLAVYFIFATLSANIQLLKSVSTDPDTVARCQNAEKKLNNLPQSYITELVYTFTFRDLSKEALVLLVESLAVMLDLDPYTPT